MVNSIYSGEFGVLNPKYVGVSYFSSRRRWSIVNLDGSAIPVGATFDVMIYETATSSSWVHSVRGDNSFQQSTWLNHPSARRGDRLLFVTPRLPPPRITTLGFGTPRLRGFDLSGLPLFSDVGPIVGFDDATLHYLNHPIGVWWSEGASTWNIYNQDYAIMSPLASFNVEVHDYINDGAGNDHSHVVVTGDRHGSSAVPFFLRSNSISYGYWVTCNKSFGYALYDQVSGPQQIRAVDNPHPIGVAWNIDPRVLPELGGASVFNEDMAALPPGVGFNVHHYALENAGKVPR